MFLLDTNIFLEILLQQEKSAAWACKAFIQKHSEHIYISDFSLHSIGSSHSGKINPICFNYLQMIYYLTSRFYHCLFRFMQNLNHCRLVCIWILMMPINIYLPGSFILL